MNTGKSVIRVDAYDKAAGRTNYTDDLCPPDALVVSLVHSTIAHGYVKAIDCSEAENIPGVVRIFTCFDVPERAYPTAGHPWPLEEERQDVADRHLLTRHVRYYGDEVAAVVAENEIAALQAVRLIKVTYQVLPFVLDVQEAMKNGAPQLHQSFPNNILKHSCIHMGDYDCASKEAGLVCVDKWYQTSAVQHCHIENHIVFAREEAGKIVLTASTQVPHILRRMVHQAIGVDYGKLRIIKPYIGGGFGNKQDALYEPLAAWICLQLGGRTVKIDTPREATFASNRVRHAVRFHLVSWLRADGTIAARKAEVFSNQGAYTSHGHAIAATALCSLSQLYPCDHFQGDAYTVYTNCSVAGAMRGYGMPQATWAQECHMEDIAAALHTDSLQFRRKHLMPVGYKDDFTQNEKYSDSHNQCFDKADAYMEYSRKHQEYQNQTGPIRKGIGIAPFWYTTATWPVCLEHSSCRMVLNEDGSIQLQLCETEIGQGADTAYAQMAADVIGLKCYTDVHVISCQDTDITPFGQGAYASRQTYIAGFSITQTGQILKKKILDYAKELTRCDCADMDLTDGSIVRVTDGRILMSLAELATEALYNAHHSEHITAQSTCQVKNSAYSFGCCCAEVTVDIPMCKITIDKIVNVHDCGRLINPALAAAQVHGGMSMGIGYALSEALRWDQATGKPLNRNFLDYKLLTAMDHPHLEVQFVENPEPTSPFGTKALGEPPTCPIAPAIRNAVFNATGVAIDTLPMNPENVFRYFSAAGLLERHSVLTSSGRI